jgi:hypothetical protein
MDALTFFGLFAVSAMLGRVDEFWIRLKCANSGPSQMRAKGLTNTERAPRKKSRIPIVHPAKTIQMGNLRCHEPMQLDFGVHGDYVRAADSL